jgi:hypothetical protein
LNLPEFSELYLAFSTIDKGPSLPVLSFDIPPKQLDIIGTLYWLDLTPVAATESFEITATQVNILQSAVL